MEQESSFGARAQHMLVASEESRQEAINPANSSDQKLEAARQQRSRIPMSVPRAKMATPEIPGYHCHWINDYPGRILQANAAGYTFVEQEESVVTSGDLAGSPVGVGSDLGSRVSIVVGKNEDGSPLRAYLMKIPNEFYKEDQLVHHERVDQVHEAMHQGRQQVDGDGSNRYVRQSSMKSTYSRRG